MDNGKIAVGVIAAAIGGVAIGALTENWGAGLLAALATGGAFYLGTTPVTLNLPSD